jgi:hypothetical protein
VRAVDEGSAHWEGPGKDPGRAETRIR